MKGRRAPGGVCPAALDPAPRGSCGAAFGERAVRDLARRFRSGGSVPGHGTDRPGSSSRALLPRHRVTPRGDTYATRPQVRWEYRCRVVCPLGAKAVPGPRVRRSRFRVPWVHPSPPCPARGAPHAVARCLVPGPCTWCPTRIGAIRAVLGDSCRPFRARPATGPCALTSPGLQASRPSRCEPGTGVLFRGGPVAAVMRVGEWAPDRARDVGTCASLQAPPAPPPSNLRPRAARRLAPAARINLQARLLGWSGATEVGLSESIAPRFSRPVPPRRCRCEVQAARADRVPASVGRGLPPRTPPARSVVQSIG
jgi:hypothetical protein